MAHRLALAGLLALAALTLPRAAAARSCAASTTLTVWPEPGDRLPTRPLLRVTSRWGHPEVIEGIGRGVQAHLLAADAAVPLAVVAAGRHHRLAWAELRPTAELAPRTAYVLHFVLPDGRVELATDERGRPLTWTTADGPDRTPPRLVRRALPLRDWFDGDTEAIEFALPTADDGPQALQVTLSPRPADARAGRRGLDPSPLTLWVTPWHGDHFLLGTYACTRAGDVGGPERRWAMTITAVDAGGNETRVPGEVVFAGVGGHEGRDLDGRRPRPAP